VPALVLEQMTSVMAFLGSDAASRVNRVSTLVDPAHVSSALARLVPHTDGSGAAGH
jgi:hypothetical protein